MTALLFALAAHLFWGVLHRLTLLRLLTTGMVLGALLSVKLSSLLFVPMALAMLGALAKGTPAGSRSRGLAAPDAGRSVAGLRRARPHRVGDDLAIYGFRYSADIPGVSSMLNWDPAPIGFAGRAADALRSGHWLRKPTCSTCSSFAAHGAMELPPRGLLHPRLVDVLPGRISVQDPAAGADHPGRGRRRLRAMSPVPCAALRADSLVRAAGGLSGAAIVVRFDIGSRHLLPAYAPLFIVAGRPPPGTAQMGAGRAARIRGWLLAENLRVGSDHMAYFNELPGAQAGAPRGGRQLAGVGAAPAGAGNVARASDGLLARLFRLFRLCRPATLPPRPGDAITSFIDERGDVAPAPLRPGTYVISATLLHTLHGAAAGPWTLSYELAYRGLRPDMRHLEADAAGGRLPTPDEAARYRWYDGLRFARLAAYLRTREPDERVTYSTLVYEVTAASCSGSYETRSLSDLPMNIVSSTRIFIPMGPISEACPPRRASFGLIGWWPRA